MSANLDERVGDHLRVWPAHADEGGCNFCDRPHGLVMVLQGARRTWQARICDRCWVELRELGDRYCRIGRKT